MPFHPIFHERHATALVRVRHDHIGTRATGRERGGPRRRRDHRPPGSRGRTRNFSAIGSRSATSPRRAESLKSVVVDHDGQVFELVLAGKNQCLPARALVPFAIGRQAVDPSRLRLESLGLGEPGCRARHRDQDCRWRKGRLRFLTPADDRSSESLRRERVAGRHRAAGQWSRE